MHVSRREEKMRHYEHWETWIGLLLPGLCAGLGSYLGGEYFGHSSISAGIGGGIGALLFRVVTKYVDRRYYSRVA
jgi:ABC-type thiamin/hydroxymethylpyrimidine transport system permease subunit